jgi:hypothetical protein
MRIHKQRSCWKKCQQQQNKEIVAFHRHVPPALFASLVLLTAAAKRKEKNPIKTNANSGHITNHKQSIFETFDIKVAFT